MGGVWRTAKRDSTGYCSSRPSTSSSLHGLLFIHPRPPPASTYDCSSTGSCSSSLHRALLHRLLFNQPSPRAPVQPPSTGYYSSSPPSSTVHPTLHGVVLFIQPSTGSCSSTHNWLDRSGSCSSSGNGLYYHGVLFIQPLPGTVHPTPPPNNAHCSSTGSRFDRLQLAVVAKESLDRVQLTARLIDRSGSVTRSMRCNRSGTVGERLARVQLEPNALHPRAYVYERNTHRSAPDLPQ